MASTTVRRPLPALISLLALLLLTGIVWWRVVNRDNNSSGASCPSPSAAASQPAALPAPASITLQVLNATKRAGLAGKVRTSLQQYGFQVPAKAGNDPANKVIPTTAQIRFGPTGRQAATLLRYYFPGATLVPTTSPNATVVVSLGERYRAIATQAAVAAALRGDKLSVASPAPSPSAAATSSKAC